jgi:hypothetical protein
MSIVKSVTTAAFKLAQAVTGKAVQIVSPFTPEFVKTKVEMAAKLAEKIYENPYETTKEYYLNLRLGYFHQQSN